jgi:hypothetical protein
MVRRVHASGEHDDRPSIAEDFPGRGCDGAIWLVA